MSEFNGTKLRVYTGSTPALIELETDLELKVTSSAVNYRNKDSAAWREILDGAGEVAADLSFNFHADISATANNNFEALYDDIVAQNLVDVKIATTDTGWVTLAGKFKITDLTITAADQTAVEGSCSMMSAGALTKGAVG